MEPNAKPCLDLAELRELYGEELLEALLREFRNSVPAMLDAARDAVTARDAHGLFQCAHRLKSAISNLYSDGAGQAAAELERIGRYQQLHGADAALPVLEAELTRLLAAVDEAMAGMSGDDPAPR